jgi:diguanylate cyclase (GGDEF)-like protein
MLQLTPEGSNSLAVLIDEDGVIAEASADFCNLVGLHRARGRLYRDLLGGNQRRRWTLLCEELAASGEQTEDHDFFNGSGAVIRFRQLERPGQRAMISGTLVGPVRSGPGARAQLWPADSLGGETPTPESAAIFKRLRTRIEQLEKELAAARSATLSDPLTGILNRAGLDLRLRSELQKPGAESAGLFLAVLDIDDFKQVNELYGQPAGDRFLRAFARRSSAPASVICAARIRGDRFALLFRTNPASPKVVAVGMSSVLARMCKPVSIGAARLRLTASAGVCAFGPDAHDSDDLLRNAETALHEAKRRGKDNVHIFDADLAARARRRKVLLRDLKLAIAEGLLHPVYQPILSTREPDAAGVEVLTRWYHHEYGSIPPDEFIPIAAECGLMSALDLAMMAAACTELYPLMAAGALKFAAFNLTPLELSHPPHVEAFLEILKAAGIPATQVWVEVTENEMIRNFEDARLAVQTLKAAGITIVLDDYGTGFSNLRTLLDLPIDVIKIDKSLIADVALEERAMQVVLSVVHLARVLGAQLVAEGIETSAQAAVTQALGCQFAQGYLFSKPMRVGGLGEWLRQTAKAGHDRLRALKPGSYGQISRVS